MQQQYRTKAASTEEIRKQTCKDYSGQEWRTNWRKITFSEFRRI